MLKFRFFSFLLLAAVASGVFLANCGPARDPIPTGITTAEMGAGQIRVTATGRAEQGTIDRANGAMMRTTSCDAARLLLKNELKSTAYKNPSRNFKESSEVHLIYNGEYCRLSGIYDPAGKFEPTTP